MRMIGMLGVKEMERGVSGEKFGTLAILTHQITFRQITRPHTPLPVNTIQQQKAM